MKQAFILIITATIFFSCEKSVKISEGYLIEKKIEAFKFLSDYHHQLHTPSKKQIKRTNHIIFIEKSRRKKFCHR